MLYPHYQFGTSPDPDPGMLGWSHPPTPRGRRTDRDRRLAHILVTCALFLAIAGAVLIHGAHITWTQLLMVGTGLAMFSLAIVFLVAVPGASRVDDARTDPDGD